MRIYLLGYFGSGAYADDLIRDITREMILEICPDAVIDDRTTRPCPTTGEQVADFFNKFYDLVIFCGGSLLGRLRLPPFHRIEQWADKLKTPLILLGTGWREEIDPLNAEETERMRLLLDTAEAVFVRGRLTVTNIYQRGLPADKVKALGDPGLCFVPGDAMHVPAPRKFGVVVRQMSNIEIQQDPERTCPNEQFQWELAKLLDHLVHENCGQFCYFFPFCPPNRSHDNDYEGIKAVQSMMKNRHLTRVADDYSAFGLRSMVTAMGKMDFVISQRLHGTLPNIAQGAVTFPIEYQFGKMTDSLSIDGLERLKDLITPMKRVTKDEFLKKQAELNCPDLIRENMEACQGLRAKYLDVIRGFIK